MAGEGIKNIFAKLIDKQFKRQYYSLKQKVSPKKVYPTISISRETGSGGRLIASLVAKKLKMKLYDKEFVELVAKSAKKRKEVVETLDEKSRGMIEGIIISVGSNQKKFSESSYLHHLYQVVLSLTRKNKAVILGRGANFIIPPKTSLSIRIIAPLKVRIKNAVKYEKKSLAKAKADIKKIHYSRKDFIRRYFQKNISNANYYDLVINTENISVKKAANIIAKAFKEKFPQEKI
jgi:cytidylate kinase